ncbi:hypothetical protein Tsubulata_004862 [Turnera subulata]|uniref:Exonuclease 1 n=1 Tax=Turnera subulata TaxID=218843 RepID=A0A9Q0GI27_9ROSI|nr:hypothetical protein Tsubulata_004862 [Turnera subulata]
MGIQGLLPLLKSTMEPIHIKELQGCSVAVDTYSWLHKGALSCSTQLCKGLPTSRHIEYCMHRVNLLRHYGVKPVLVFDGGLLPMKMEQENKRARTRKENLARAIEHESNGNSAAAYECYQKAVDISPSIAHELIQVLKQENVAYVVAPYEADAQMTFLAVNKQVDAVITEDSDLIPFGCPRIIFKMDKYGQGVEFQYSRLQRNKELSFSGFNHNMLLEMCILSGCDYLSSLPGMGLKRAHALIVKFKSYDKVIKHLKYSTVSVPPTYEELFKKAILTFQHQRVYDPVSENIVHLSDTSDHVGDDLDFLGPSMPQDTAKAIAEGDLDPFTQLPFQGENANSRVAMEKTCKGEMLKPQTGRKKLDLPVQKNLLTKYFCIHSKSSTCFAGLIFGSVQKGFASLEAKRKFRAPRASPADSTSTESPSPSPDDINCNNASSLDSVENNNISSSPANNPAEKDSAGTVDFLESQSHGVAEENGSPEHISIGQLGHSIHQPGQALLKECDFKNAASAIQDTTTTNFVNAPSAVLDKTRTGKGKVLVRSSYFQHKPVNKSNTSNELDRLLVKDDVATNACEDKGVEISCNPKGTRENVITRSPYFQHSSAKNNKKDHKQERLLPENDADATDTCEDTSLRSSGNLRSPCDNINSRSFYFQEKSGTRDDQDNGKVASDACEVVIPENGYSLNNPFDSFSMKRKTSMNGTVERENMKTKYLRTNASLATNEECCDPDLDETVTMTKTKEGKFGSDISHLSRYSDVAEKSMENFVSMLSSFRYTSSGSRASGLRPPLKDIRNTCINKSTGAVDFSRFAYTPKDNKNNVVASRRR